MSHGCVCVCVYVCIMSFPPVYCLNVCVCTCLCVCAQAHTVKRGIAEGNEGHPEDLDSCMCRRLTETLSILRFICVDFFVSPWYMYEEYLHGSTRAITNGQTLVEHQAPQPSAPPPPTMFMCI